jgi:hypothetical protein
MRDRLASVSTVATHLSMDGRPAVGRTERVVAGEAAPGIPLRGATRDRCPGVRWLSAVAGTLLGINVFAIWLGTADAATLPTAVAVAAGLAPASLSLRRASASPLTAMVTAAASSVPTADMG